MLIRNISSKSRPIRVLIGNSDGLMSDTISSVISHAFESRFEVRAVAIGSPCRFLDWAMDQEYDLFVVVLNNLVICGVEERLSTALRIVSCLKTEYGKPVIAMAGYPTGDALFVAEAIRAGADAFFPLPFDCTEFTAAVRKLLALNANW